MVAGKNNSLMIIPMERWRATGSRDRAVIYVNYIEEPRISRSHPSQDASAQETPDKSQ